MHLDRSLITVNLFRISWIRRRLRRYDCVSRYQLAGWREKFAGSTISGELYPRASQRSRVMNLAWRTLGPSYLLS